MAVLRSLVTTLGMNSSQYREDLKRAQTRTDQFHAGVKRGAANSSAAYAAMARQAATTATALITAATAASVALAKQADYMLRLSEQSRMGFEDFQSLAFATSQYGIEAEKLADISKDVTDKLGDFLATGGGPMKDFFEQVAPKVNLTAEALKGLSGPEVLQAVKNAMDQANISMESQVFYLESIANDASRLEPLLRNNGELQRQMSIEFERGNRALSAADAEKLRAMNIHFNNMAQAANVAASRIAAQLSPAIIGLSNLLEQAFSPEDATAKLEASLSSFDSSIALKRAEIEAIQSMSAQDTYKTMGTGYGLKHQAGIEAEKNRQLSEANKALAALVAERAGIQAQLDEINKPFEPAMIPDALPLQYQATEASTTPTGGITPEELARQAELSAQWISQLQQRMMTEEELILYRAEQEAIRAQTELTNAQQQAQALVLIEQNKNQQIDGLRKREAAAQAQIQQQQLAAYGGMFGEMAELTGAFAGEQSGAYKAMFAASKAFNIATTLSSSFPAIAQAWASSPWPSNLPAVATTIFETGALTAAAQAVQLTGIAHSGITTIPDEGTWLLDKGERVLSARQNADLTSYLGKNGSAANQGNLVVQVIDNAGVNTEVNEREDELGQRVLEIMLTDQRSGGEITAGYQSMWGLNRKGQF